MGRTGYLWSSRHRTRARRHGAGVIQRAWRRKKGTIVYKKKNHGRPTIRGKTLPAKNARAIRKLLANQDPKFVLRSIYNKLIFTNLDWNTKLELTDIPSVAGIATPPNAYNYREDDAVEVHLKTIRVSFTVHASAVEGTDIQKYYVALVKTTNKTGATNGIELPTPQEVFDPSSCEYDNQPGQTSLLAPWQGFRKTQGDFTASTLENFTILKEWYGYVSPTMVHRPQHLQIDERQTGGPLPTAVSCVGDLDTTAYQPEENLTALGSKMPNVITRRYTHKCMNAKLSYPNNTSTDCTNVKYFLVSLASGTEATTGYRLNACCKVNFVSD